MTDLAQHIHELLTAALPPTTPVLLPEQAESVLNGRLPGQAGGISGYLQAHPGGYVQIEVPIGAGVNDYVVRWWITAAALHATPAGAGALAEQIRRALTGRPDEPGPGFRVLADAPQSIGAAFVCRSTYEFTELDGRVAAEETP
ncbi:hypothetical protein ACMT4L_17085 [Deinococcus sp. A31D244]|uniref:hypothetical protein n=1 Tax=Deinococcus sp. A31D244 TaxID=3397675 RepID=UPI0039E05200